MNLLNSLFVTIRTRLTLFFKIFTQLPSRHLLSLAIYRFSKGVGLLRLFEKPSVEGVAVSLFTFDYPNNHSFSEDSQQKILEEADFVLTNRVRLFGAVEEELVFADQREAGHWSTHRGDQFEGRDVKFAWEPARFCWAIPVAQAFWLTKEERYAEFLWAKIEEFAEKNPAYCGIQWVSAQEVAMRIITLGYVVSLIESAKASSAERMQFFSGLIEQHAKRIPSTLSYAKAQNNNHLVSEAVGLYTAGILLKEHGDAAGWRKVGLKTFEGAIKNQVFEDGSYAQHSVRYHRLFLELANWMMVMLHQQDDSLNEACLALLRKSVAWLLPFCNATTGRCPNLGPNDGAYLMPFLSWDFDDARPILNASGILFCDEIFFEGEAAMMGCEWLGLDDDEGRLEDISTLPSVTPASFLYGETSYAYFRTAKFLNRPGHADQFHVDLWYHNENVLLDAGTYLYNGDAPWENVLANTQFHNVLSVERKNQMTRGGKFLWLDWANAQKIEHLGDAKMARESVSAVHVGYGDENVRHQRIVDVNGDEWLLKDTVFRKSMKKEDVATISFHLLAKNPKRFEMDGTKLVLVYDDFSMQISVVGFDAARCVLIRGGEVIFGDAVDFETVNYGWFSPTYGVKEPAVSIFFEDEMRLPSEILTKICFIN